VAKSSSTTGTGVSETPILYLQGTAHTRLRTVSTKRPNFIGDTQQDGRFFGMGRISACGQSLGRRRGSEGVLSVFAPTEPTACVPPFPTLRFDSPREGMTVARALPQSPFGAKADRTTRAHLASEASRQLYAKRVGLEGTLSQGVRTIGLRHSRSIGLAKTHLQQVASTAALNLDRVAAWCTHRPRALTRMSRLAALAG
jgi:hypothetical protein